MNNYFEENEQSDYNKLLKLNEKQNWFNYTERLELKSTIDVSGYTRNDDVVYIELKSRNITLQKARDFKWIFIETDKMKEFNVLTRKHKGKIKRLFINFLKDATIIFNMNKPMTLQYLPNQRINNVGYDEYQIQDRIGLDINDALIIYNTNPN